MVVTEIKINLTDVLPVLGKLELLIVSKYTTDKTNNMNDIINASCRYLYYQEDYDTSKQYSLRDISPFIDVKKFIILISKIRQIIKDSTLMVCLEENLPILYISRIEYMKMNRVNGNIMCTLRVTTNKELKWCDML